MKEHLLAGIVAGALAGAVAGLAASSFFAPARETASDPAKISLSPGGSADIGGTSEIRAELETLRAKNVDLSQRLAELEDLRWELEQTRVPARENPSDVAIDVETVDQLRRLTAALEDPGTPLPENLLAGVSSALQTIREEEDRERDEQRRAAEAERFDERIVDLTDRLGLTLVQTDQMRGHMETMSDRRSELMREARDSGDFGSIRQQMRGLRDEANAGLGEILTPAQFDDYREIEREEGNPFGGRGGRRGEDEGRRGSDSRE
jgi:hypothetical protein